MNRQKNVLKKEFVDEGLLGGVYLLIGTGLMLPEKTPITLLITVLLITLVLLLIILAANVQRWRQKSMPIDETTKQNMQKAKSIVYEIIFSLGLAITFIAFLLGESEYPIKLNWYIFMVIYGGCKITCYLMYQYFNKNQANSGDE